MSIPPYEYGLNKPDDIELCPICMDHDKFAKSWVKLKCSHCFHRDCIDLWFEKKQTCPICVRNVYIDIDIDIDQNIDINNNINNTDSTYCVAKILIRLLVFFILCIVIICIILLLF